MNTFISHAQMLNHLKYDLTKGAGSDTNLTATFELFPDENNNMAVITKL
jgi:hypothetical protein